MIQELLNNIGEELKTKPVIRFSSDTEEYDALLEYYKHNPSIFQYEEKDIALIYTPEIFKVCYANQVFRS